MGLLEVAAIATERINIIVQESGSRTVQRNLKDIGTSAGSSAVGVNLLRRTLLTLGVGIGLSEAIRTISTFEQAMSGLRAVSTANAADFARLRDAAKNLGVTTEFSAAQIAEGFATMSRAGFDVNEQLMSMKNVADLATAGHMDLQTAAHSTSIIMKSFRLEANAAAEITDTLAFIANRTTANVGELAQSMKYVGPVATGLKVSLGQTAAALATLIETGLGARQAGSGFLTIISDLERPTAALRTNLRRLSINTDSVRISQVGLVAALQSLKRAGVNTTEAMTLFGDANGQVLDTLIKALPQLENYTELIGKSGDYAANSARILRDNLGGALRDVKSAIEAAMISLGDLGNTSALTTVVRALADAILYLANHAEILEGALVGLALTALPRAISMAIRLLSVLGGSGILIGAAIGALAAYRDEIHLSSARMATLGDLAQAAWERIKLGAETAFSALREKFSGFNIALDGVNFSIEGFVLLTARVLDAWIGLWRGAILAVVGLLKNLGPVMKEIAINIVNDLISIADFGLKKFYEMLGKLPGRVGEPYRRLVEEGVISRLQQTATGSMERLGQAVVDGFTKGFNEITVFEDSVNQMFNRADEIARERLAKMAQSTPEQGLSGGQGAAPTPGIETDPAQKLSQMQIGVQGGLEKLGTIINQWSTQVETTMVNAFSSAEDALVEFVQTGKFNFKGLVDSMLADLTRLLFRQMLAKTIGGMLPTGGAGMNFGGPRAGGGPVEPGSYYVVGERGREVFSPSVPGQIIPTDRLVSTAPAPAQQGPAPQVNIINVESMEQALAAMRSSEGQRIIFNSRGQER